MSRTTPTPAQTLILRMIHNNETGRFNPYTFESCVKQGWVDRQTERTFVSNEYRPITVKYSLSEKALVYLDANPE